MDRRMFAATVCAAAVGFAGVVAAVSPTASAAMMSKEQMMKVRQANMVRAKAEHLAKCYGVNAIGKNDCAAGAHSCAGQSTKANDPGSFVLLPAGDCAKIHGGSLTPA
jgi:uncharacterized membrane protein